MNLDDLINEVQYIGMLKFTQDKMLYIADNINPSKKILVYFKFALLKKV